MASGFMYAFVVLMLIAAFVGGWGISLIVRAAARRIELARARMLAEAGRPVPPHLRVPAIIGMKGALAIGSTCILAGCASAFAGLSIEWWVGLREFRYLVDNWWAVGACGWVVAAIALIATGAWFDRSKGRPRCPTCWYDVESMIKVGEGGAFAELQCPECGRRITRSRELYRTRRHVFLIRMGLFMLVCSYLTLATPRTIRFGASGIVPTTAMIVCMSYLPDSLLMEPNFQQRWTMSGATQDSLFGRMQDPTTWHWQREWFYEELGQAWERPRTKRDLRVAMLTRWANRESRVTALQAHAVLDALLDADAQYQSFATEMLMGGVYAGEAGNEAAPTLKGRSDDILRAAATTHGSRVAWLLLIFAGNEPIDRWAELRPSFEATQWEAKPVDHKEIVITLATLAKRSPEIAAYIVERMGEMQARQYDAVSTLILFHGPGDLRNMLESRWMLAQQVLDADLTLEVRMECARKLAKLGRSPHSERAVRALRGEDAVKQDAGLSAELRQVFEEVRVHSRRANGAGTTNAHANGSEKGTGEESSD